LTQQTWRFGDCSRDPWKIDRLTDHASRYDVFAWADNQVPKTGSADKVPASDATLSYPVGTFCSQLPK
jgi:hypothetical protein